MVALIYGLGHFPQHLFLLRAVLESGKAGSEGAAGPQEARDLLFVQVAEIGVRPPLLRPSQAHGQPVHVQSSQPER